jgi:FkbM family methyltransferase
MGARRFSYAGLSIELPTELATPAIKNALEGGWYEAGEIEQLPNLLQDGEVVLEIGAGLGLMSTLAAKDKRTKEVHAVEANPKLIPVIAANHKLNNAKVKVYNELLADADGEVDFYVHRDFWASSLTYWAGAEVVKIKKKRFQTRLDEIKPTMLIVDIEGGETHLFDNVSMPTVEKILIELHLNNVGRDNVLHLFQVLGSKGFHYDQWHSKGPIVTFSAVDRDERTRSRS